MILRAERDLAVSLFSRGAREHCQLLKVTMGLLLVEDDVMGASGIKLGLYDAGYAVDWVGSAERAEEVLQQEAFEAAIIDISLPKMDGLRLTRSIQKSGVTTPVLILTVRDALQKPGSRA